MCVSDCDLRCPLSTLWGSLFFVRSFLFLLQLFLLKTKSKIKSRRREREDAGVSFSDLFSLSVQLISRQSNIDSSHVLSQLSKSYMFPFFQHTILNSFWSLSLKNMTLQLERRELFFVFRFLLHSRENISWVDGWWDKNFESCEREDDSSHNWFTLMFKFSNSSVEEEFVRYVLFVLYSSSSFTHLSLRFFSFPRPSSTLADIPNFLLDGIAIAASSRSLFPSFLSLS